MSNDISFTSLQNQIVTLENKVAETTYFIETASCVETKKIYQGTQAELIEELSALYKLRDQFSLKHKIGE